MGSGGDLEVVGDHHSAPSSVAKKDRGGLLELDMVGAHSGRPDSSIRFGRLEFGIKA
jgi:hypothetical protein